jgi:DNA polymerase-3 subunit beta
MRCNVALFQFIGVHMKFSIQRKFIRAMLHLAAKKDIRYYLQGIHVVRDNRGTYLEATDGHLAGRLLIDGIKSDTKISVILPTEALSKLKGTKKQSDEWLHFEVNGLSVECIDSQSTTRFSACDGRFPDIDRVLPLVLCSTDVSPGHYNIDLLSRFVDVSEELFGKRQTPSIFQRGNSSAVVSFALDEDFVGVVMPMRQDSPAKVPAWCYIPSTKPVETTEAA